MTIMWTVGWVLRVTYAAIGALAVIRFADPLGVPVVVLYPVFVAINAFGLLALQRALTEW